MLYFHDESPVGYTWIVSPPAGIISRPSTGQLVGFDIIYSFPTLLRFNPGQADRWRLVKYDTFL